MDPEGGTGGTSPSPSSGGWKRHTDSGFSLALVQRMLLILLVAPVTTATVERSNSSLAYVKTNLQSTMGDGCLNDLIMLYINKDTPLDYTAVIDRYAAKQLRRMLLVNPLQDPEEQITDYDNLYAFCYI